MSTSGIYGLSGSGIDVDSMVKVGMLSKQNEYDKLYKKEVRNEWMKEAYADVYSDVSTFSNSTLSTYKMSYTTNPMSVTSSNTGVATAVANSNAVGMTHNVSVTKTASTAYLLTEKNITRANDTVTSPADKKADTQDGKPSSIKLKDVIFDSSHQSIPTGKDGSDIAVSFTLSDGVDESGSPAKIEFTYDEIFNSEQTLNDLVSKLNNSGANVKAAYDATNDALSLNQQDSGDSHKITLSLGDATGDARANAATLLNNLQLAQVSTETKDGTSTSTLGSVLQLDATDSTSKIEAAGTNAEATIDGKTYSSESNKITAANVTYTLNSTGSSTMSVSQDTDKAVENVKKFVEEYNKMMDKLNDKFNEKQYSDYGVLTKSQENAMTQDQITKWNEKAKSGLLYHDRTLNKIRSDMREALYTPVESVDSSYNTMMSIGIESSTDQGHLVLNEDKLKKALAADPDCVYQIFASSGNVTTKNADGSTKLTTDYDKEGVVNRLYDKLNSDLKDMKSYSGTSSTTSDGSSLGVLISDLQTKMKKFQTQMDAYEKLLYKKYDAMESTIAQLSAQFNYISGGH